MMKSPEEREIACDEGIEVQDSMAILYGYFNFCGKSQVTLSLEQ